MPSAAEKLMTLDEFLAWEREQPDRHEFSDGVIRMMTGGSLDHSTIASNLHRALSDRLRGGGCLAFRGDTKVIAAGNVRYPDVSVTCSSRTGGDDIVPEPEGGAHKDYEAAANLLDVSLAQHYAELKKIPTLKATDEAA